jgi:hypothetical protein
VLVLDYHERLLIRRALQVMSTCSGEQGGSGNPRTAGAAVHGT